MAGCEWLQKNFEWRVFCQEANICHCFGHSRSVHFSTVDFGHMHGNEIY